MNTRFSFVFQRFSVYGAGSVEPAPFSYHTAMETSRNADMLEVAKGYLDSGKTVFFADYLAHLGDGGLTTGRPALQFCRVFGHPTQGGGD